MKIEFICVITFIIGFLLSKWKKNSWMHQVRHRCKPHHCNLHSLSCACFERENGEFWIKEYSNSKEKEGRTYQVSFCPWCGQEAKSKMNVHF
jgi:hypothetical protein